VVAGGRRTRKTRKALREKLVVGLFQRRPGGYQPGAEVERYDEADKSRAAEMSSSKSGTSASS
jgi:hypothetical protein